MCVLCRTFDTDVNMHDLGVCVPPTWSRNGVLTSNVHNFDFQILIQVCIRSRECGKPRWALLSRARSVKPVFQFRARIFFLCREILLSGAHPWSARVPARILFVQSIMDIIRFIQSSSIAGFHVCSCLFLGVDLTFFLPPTHGSCPLSSLRRRTRLKIGHLRA